MRGLTGNPLNYSEFSVFHTFAFFGILFAMFGYWGWFLNIDDLLLGGGSDDRQSFIDQIDTSILDGQSMTSSELSGQVDAVDPVQSGVRYYDPDISFFDRFLNDRTEPEPLYFREFHDVLYLPAIYYGFVADFRSYWPADDPDFCEHYDYEKNDCISLLASGDDWRIFDQNAVACPAALF